MQQGWIPVYRKIQENWMWKEKPFSKGQAWIDLIMLANYEDKKMPYKGEIITCKRGTVNLSISFLAERWGWGREKTRGFLKLLESDKMVTVNATKHRTTITIENYAIYNDITATNQTTNRDTQPITSRQSVDTTNNNKQLKQVNNVIDIQNSAKPQKHKHGEYNNVLLTDDEYQKLKTEYQDIEERIERLSEYIASTGKKYKSHYATIRAWARKEKGEKNELCRGESSGTEKDNAVENGDSKSWTDGRGLKLV